MESNLPSDRRRAPCRNCEYERLRDELQDLWALVADLETPGEVLEEISRRSPAILLERVAEHPNAEPALLERLSYHPSTEVRAAVAENLNTPTSIMFALTHDSNPDVRYAIAENHNSPTEVLELLCEDENPYVAYRATMTMMRIGPQRQAQQIAFPRIVERREWQTG